MIFMTSHTALWQRNMTHLYHFAIGPFAIGPICDYGNVIMVKFYRSLLQKSPTKETIFCKSRLYQYPLCNRPLCNRLYDGNVTWHIFITYSLIQPIAEYSLFCRALLQKRPIKFYHNHVAIITYSLIQPIAKRVLIQPTFAEYSLKIDIFLQTLGKSAPCYRVAKTHRIP